MYAMKTLDAPVLDRLLDPLGRIFTPEVARRLVNYRFDGKAQARIDKLARKCNEGELSPAERAEYETLQRLSQAALERKFPAPRGIAEELARIEARLGIKSEANAE